MKLSREEVKHIGLLVRLGLNEADIEMFRHQLSDILDNFEILKQVDTSDLPPTTHIIALQNVLRSDEPTPSCPIEEMLANAPQQDSNFFKTRAVLE